MTYATADSQILHTFDEVSNYSIKKKAEESELVTNDFLDEILKLKSVIKEDCVFLENLTTKFEKLTWISTDNQNQETQKEELRLLQAIISMTKDIHKHLIMRYVFLNNKASQYASQEIKRFKLALDDIKESCNDLEEVFLYLPSSKEFNELNDLLDEL